jgi:hypothetical protein
MKKLSLLGILVGGVVDVVSSAVLGVPLAIVAVVSYSTAHAGVPPHDVTSVMHSSLSLTIGAWLVGGACSVLGGYVAARMAKHDEILNGACSAWLCTASGLLFWKADNTPLWQHVILLVVSPLLGAAGGYLFGRLKRAESPLAAA